MSIEKDKTPRKTPAKKAATAAAATKKANSPAKPKVETSSVKAAPKAKTAAKTAGAAKAPKASTALSNYRHQPTHQQIADLAHSYYVERGWQHGQHEQDWLRAERELLTSV